jgi:hypothetical protein
VVLVVVAPSVATVVICTIAAAITVRRCAPVTVKVSLIGPNRTFFV